MGDYSRFPGAHRDLAWQRGCRQLARKTDCEQPQYQHAVIRFWPSWPRAPPVAAQPGPRVCHPCSLAVCRNGHTRRGARGLSGRLFDGSGLCTAPRPKRGAMQFGLCTAATWRLPIL